MNKSIEKIKRKYKSLFELAPDAVAFIDSEGIIREVNEKACKALKCSKEELLGMPLIEHPFYSGEDREKFLKRAEKVFRGEKVPPETYEVETADGEKRYIEVQNSLLRKNGEFQGLILIARDITDRKEAEEEREFLNTLLRQDLGIKCQTIEGYLQLIETKDLTEKDRKGLRRALRATREANEMIKMAKKLREIKEAESISRKDISKVLEHAVDSVSHLAEERGVRIEEDCPEKIGKVKGDYSLNILFSQILKTRIPTFRCEKIKLSVEEDKEKVLVKVEDDGGRLPEKAKNLFSGKAYTGETTGVGGVMYYVIRKIAEHNEATVEAKNSDMGGARFDVYLQKSK